MMDAGQSRSLAETKHVVHDVQGCRVYRAGQAFEQGQHHEGNQGSAMLHTTALAN